MQNITEITTKGAGFDHAHANNNSQFSSRSSQLAEKARKSLICRMEAGSDLHMEAPAKLNAL